MTEAEAAGLNLPAALPEGVRNYAIMDTLPGKKPLIKLSYRPPNYETPIEYFRTAITPNDVFYVRYHNDIPQVDAKTWKVKIGGEAANGELELNLDDLNKIAGLRNRRRQSMLRQPPRAVRAARGRRGMGLWRDSGRACWKGARLKDILDKVGLKQEAIEIVLNGADGPAASAPDFVKSIPVWKAMEETTLIAYEMNGQPLPHYNGFPARIIVPGWTGTYWMKHITTINAVTKPESNFWMNPAYRIPLGKFPLVARFTSQDSAVNTPITEMVVELADHQPPRWRHREAGRRCRWHRLGRRLRHYFGRHLDRRWQDLAAGEIG